jgi:hypothetical protein
MEHTNACNFNAFIGLQFWRQNSRKVYAVNMDNHKSPAPAKRRTVEQDDTLINDHDVQCHCREIHNKLESIFKVTKTALPLPIGVISEFQPAFLCLICQDIISHLFGQALAAIHFWK